VNGRGGEPQCVLAVRSRMPIRIVFSWMALVVGVVAVICGDDML
jgi:hypothetical protein